MSSAVSSLLPTYAVAINLSLPSVEGTGAGQWYGKMRGTAHQWDSGTTIIPLQNRDYHLLPVLLLFYQLHFMPRENVIDNSCIL